MNKIAIDTVRLDTETKNQFLTLKRRTGIENWNVLARWAFCVSLSDLSPVRKNPGVGAGAIEMSWRTFTGEADLVYWALLFHRCRRESEEVTRETLSETLRLHIGRGAARLVSDRKMKSIADFVDIAITAEKKEG
jgi:DNA sulfur modification protein DndE